MKKWTDIESIKAGDIVLRSLGLLAKPSKIEVLSIEISGTMAWMTWKWHNNTSSYYATSFRKSTNLIDYGFWHDVISNQYDLNQSN